MLSKLIENLKRSKTDAEREKWYKALEQVGVDRMTANILIKELM